jgi:2-hydroxychromene-2-carboxylate isomerase
LKPFYLEAVINATGNHGPVEVATKAKYARLEIERNNIYFGMDLKLPPKFPSDTLLAQRVLGTLARDSDPSLIPAIRNFWKAYWFNGSDISSFNTLVAALVKQA